MTSLAHAITADGEKVMFRADVSHWTNARSYALSIALVTATLTMLGPPTTALSLVSAGALTLVSCWITAVAALKKRSTEFVLTNRCLIAKWGVFSRTTVEITLDRIESLHIRQTFLGRLLNYGDITVVGVGASLEPLHGVKHPREVREVVCAAVHAQPRPCRRSAATCILGCEATPERARSRLIVSKAHRAADA